MKKQILYTTLALLGLTLPSAAGTSQLQRLEQAAQKQVQQQEGYLLFCSAVRENQLSLAEALLEKGINPNQRLSASDVSIKDGMTDLPLSIAVEHDYVQMAALLLEYGAEVNAPSFFNWTPLMRVRSGAMARLLLEHGASVLSVDSMGRTPLMRVSVPEAVEQILGKKPSLNEKDQFGNTALMSRAKSLTNVTGKAFLQNLASLKLLLQAGADKTLANQEGQTPCAVIQRRAESLKTGEASKSKYYQFAAHQAELQQLLCK